MIRKGLIWVFTTQSIYSTFQHEELVGRGPSPIGILCCTQGVLGRIDDRICGIGHWIQAHTKMYIHVRPLFYTKTKGEFFILRIIDWSLTDLMGENSLKLSIHLAHLLFFKRGKTSSNIQVTTNYGRARLSSHSTSNITFQSTMMNLMLRWVRSITNHLSRYQMTFPVMKNSQSLDLNSKANGKYLIIVSSWMIRNRNIGP